MAITLYDLVGVDDRRFSTHCWRVRLAMAHMGLEVETVPTGFSGIAGVGDGSHRFLPIVEDNGTWLCESWPIARHLADTYPDRPDFFGGAAGRELSRFVQHWLESQINAVLISILVKDIHDHLQPEDRAYFRKTREARIGCTLEEAHAVREGQVAELRARLEPLRRRVAEAPFLGGDAPLYADYLAVAPLIWARKVCPLPLLQRDDPVHAWLHRCLDLYDGLARHGAGYDW